MERTVLVVEDEPDIADLLVIWLADDVRCRQLWVAADLDEALQLAESGHPDTIVLDFRVRGRTADSILPELRDRCPRSRIIVHTANRDAALAADVLSQGADLLLEKATTSIAEVIDAALDDTPRAD